MYNYKEIKGLNLGKIASLPNSENVINLHASFQSIAKKNPPAHHETHLHKMKVGSRLIPRSPLGTTGSIGLLFGSHTQRKRNPLFIESRPAKASLTLNISKNQAEFNEMRQTLHFVIDYYLPIILLLCVIPVIPDILVMLISILIISVVTVILSQ